MIKKPYMAPALESLGDVVTITQGSIGGNNTDATFPVNTPFDELTFTDNNPNTP